MRTGAQPALDAAEVLAKAVRSAAAHLELRSRDLSLILGSSEASVSRLSKGRGLDPESKEGQLALLFLRAYRSLDAMMGGDDARARAWLRAHNEHIGAVPLERMKAVEGLVDVVHYLDAMRGRL